MNELQRIQELEEEVKKLKEQIRQLVNPDIVLDSLSGTFLAVDLNNHIQIIQSKAPKNYKTPEVPTELTRTAYYNNTYNRKLIEEFTFPTTRNIIFRGEYAIKPDSTEGKIISFLLQEQVRMRKEDETHKERFFEITNMSSMNEAIKHVEESK